MHNHMFSGTLMLLAAVAVGTEVVPSCCLTTFSNVSSPYPFGISTGCFLPSFNLSCGDRGRNNSPTAHLGDGATGVFHHNATMRVVRNASVSVTSMRNTMKSGRWGLSGNRSWPFCRRRSPSNLSTVPMVVEWSSGGTVQDDMYSPISSVETVWCSSSTGYYGEPYNHGFQDLYHYPCHRECTNLPRMHRLCQCREHFCGSSSLIHGCVKSSSGHIIDLGVGSGVALLVLALGTIFLVQEIKIHGKKIWRIFFKQNRGQLIQLVHQMANIGERMIISLEELEKATNNFDRSCELGHGAHGTVYKGILSSQHIVAIKKSKTVIQNETDEFVNEVSILSEVNHRNIVKLIGCCLQMEVPLLFYEFIPNGTLYKHLHVRPPVSLCWKHRLRIAVETARAITYLHSFASTPIIHRDIKSTNILLDENFTVKLSDFGASRYIPVDQEGIHTTVQGTSGYLDPMYHNTGHLTKKSDVYSFGVLLIELLTRKKPVSYKSRQGFSLAKHFVSLLSEEGNLAEILDPQVAKEGDGEVIDVALLAATCVKYRSDERPAMKEVELLLENIQASKEFYIDVTYDDISCRTEQGDQRGENRSL